MTTREVKRLQAYHVAKRNAPRFTTVTRRQAKNVRFSAKKYNRGYNLHVEFNDIVGYNVAIAQTK